MKWLKRLLGPADVAAPGQPIPAPEGGLSLLECLGSDDSAELTRLIEARDITAAEALLARALQRHPGQPALLLKQASCWRLGGDAARARSACDELLSGDCDAAAVHLELAMCCLAEHDLPAAIEQLEVAVHHQPENGTAWLRLGEVLMRLDRTKDAIQPLRQATEFAADNDKPQAWFLLGEALRLQHDFAGSQAAQEMCIGLDPDHVLGQIALGHSLVVAEDDRRALQCYEKAMALSAQLPSTLRLNVGSIHQNFGELEQARSIFAGLVAQRPGDATARWYLCQLDLLQCRWREGWANFHARFGAGAVPYRPMPYQPWDGRALADDTLLVLADEGLGDEIMFASCLPDLSKRVAHCIVECEPRLLGLFSRSFPGIHFIATQRENSTRWLSHLPEPRWQISAGALPQFFRTQEADFPQHTGYLRADPVRVQAWVERLKALFGSEPVVGLSWRGGIVGTRTKARSIDPESWAPILRVPGVHFVNLQYGAYQADLESIQQMHGIRIHDFPEAIADYDETAALVSALDLVVTCCTAIVHLAGALGKPAWVLTPMSPGWRYTADRRQMPWYPSTRLFRQDAYRNWQGACHDLSLELRLLTKDVTPEHPEMRKSHAIFGFGSAPP